MNITDYVATITTRYKADLSGYQLIHKDGLSLIFMIYKADGSIEFVRLFPNRYTDELDISIEKKLTDINHTSIPLAELMQIIEVLITTLKGEI